MRKPRSRWSKLLLVVPGVYLGALAGLYVMQRHLVFQPWAATMAGRAEAAGMSEIKISAKDGVAVVHWYAPPGLGRPVVVIFHGQGGAVSDLGNWAAAFTARGYGVVLADYRGYTGNPGRPSEAGLYDDARALLAWLAERGFSDRGTVLVGWSLGSGVAVQMAVEHHPRALILLAPFSSLVDVAAEQYPIFPVRALMWDRFDNLAKIAEVGAPVMIMHGEDDRVVPTAFGRELFAAAREPKRMLLLPRTGHIIDPTQSFLAVEDFIERSANTSPR